MSLLQALLSTEKVLAVGLAFSLIRCKDSKLCSNRGVAVVLTDLNKKNNQTDFILSNKAFIALGKPGMARQLMRLCIVDIEYKRIPCEYKKHNLTVRVEESSQKPSNLAVNSLYQGGQTDILTVDVAQDAHTLVVFGSGISAARIKE